MNRTKLALLLGAALAVGALVWVFRAQLFGGEFAHARGLIAAIGLAQIDGDPALERIVLWEPEYAQGTREALIEAVDQDGTPLWTRRVPPVRHVAPLSVCGDTLMIGVSTHPKDRDAPMEVLALDPRTGAERWRWRTADGLYDHLGDVEFVGCDGGSVHLYARGPELDPRSWHALDVQSGTQRWSIPGLRTPKPPVTVGSSKVALLRSDRRPGIAVDPASGAVKDIPWDAWPDGGGRVRGIQQAGDRLTGVAFSDAEDGCVLVEWRPGSPVWTPVTTSDRPDCGQGLGEAAYRLTQDHLVTVEPTGRRLRALSRRAGARAFDIINPKPPAAFNRVGLADAPTGQLDGVIRTRYAPLLLTDSRDWTYYQILVLDTEAARVHWASEWFRAAHIDHGGRFVQGTTFWFQVKTGDEQASWVGIDGRTGRSLGAFGYHFEGSGETPPQHEEIPRLPSASDWDGDVLHTFYWLAAVAVDVSSAADGWRQTTYGGQGVVEDRRAAVERRLGVLP